SALVTPLVQNSVETYFDAERFATLRNVLAIIGGALIGATAIGFSIVMIAVQLNFARMPPGLFHKLSSDLRLLGAFALTFVLALGVALLALMPGPTWAAASLVAALW